ncbi:MAG: hypothetical protein A3I61_06610 [Acidobacteria bacterium RIFCSPLOWO2_02_FULL_68_18]|nr:MAG: hypothetical protein A3I61_06610 [Acidobacteria bacterium RIFCSPLOWO2_02_FULL_68_18]OFW50325.1 MAG: hypothetical protein A3G77_07605 [Acidobacteria bacterium RIFCSPLOWO2_12_FULL_68_19]
MSDRGGGSTQADGTYILGTGVLADEFLALLRHAGTPVAGFVENLDRGRTRTHASGLPIIWVDDLPAGAQCLCALSTTHRIRFIDQVRSRASFPTFVHPSSVVLPFGTIGPGTLVSTGVLVASHVTLGSHVFVNRGARIGHHTRIGDYVTLQPGVNVAGEVQVGSRAYIGLGAIVRERLTIGEGAIVAAGALVTHDVPAHSMVAGSPARVKRRDVEPK